MTASQEEYLNAIYILNSEEGTRITDVANFLNVQKSSTSKALNILKNEGLINYEKYKNINITKKGIAMAKHISKRNELFKRFLVEILNTDKNLVEEEAKQLSHCVSCHTTAKLEKYIENILGKQT